MLTAESTLINQHVNVQSNKFLFNFRYSLWRTMTIRQAIKFSLMEAVHTKFHPGWHFALWKVRLRGNMDYSGGNDRNGRVLYPSPPDVATAFLSLLMARRVQFVYMTGSHTSFKRFFKPLRHLTT